MKDLELLNLASGFKTCSRCKTMKALKEFPPNKNTKSGRGSHCYVCRKETGLIKRRSLGIKSWEEQRIELRSNIKEKRCNKCKEVKKIEDFYKNDNSMDGRYSICKSCQKERERDERSKGKRQVSKSRKDCLVSKHKNIRSLLLSQKGNKCASCGLAISEDNPACCFDFHHRNKEEKEYTITQLIQKGDSILLQEEIKKCDLLCALCHRKIHFNGGD